MRPPHAAYPAVLALPGRRTAEYIPSSDPPAYELDGERIEVDVVIPDDLARDGWYWNGSFLCWRAAPESCAVCVSTATYPPPPFPTERYDCYTSARKIKTERIGLDELRAMPKPSRKKRASSAAAADQHQLVMELV